MTPFLPINRGIPQGTILGPIPFSVMLNDIQAVDSDRSNLVKFADVLALSVLVKGTQDKTPQKVFWVQNNLETDGMVVKGKVERPSPIVTFDIKDEVFRKLLGVYFHSNPTNWDKQIDAFLSKAGGRMHILRVCQCGYTV